MLYTSTYSRFRVSSPVLTLHTAITHVIEAVELQRLTLSSMAMSM